MTKTWAASISLRPGMARSTAQVPVFMARHDRNLLWSFSLVFTLVLQCSELEFRTTKSLL
jgi:hypothetical protein